MLSRTQLRIMGRVRFEGECAANGLATAAAVSFRLSKKGEVRRRRRSSDASGQEEMALAIFGDFIVNERTAPGACFPAFAERSPESP